jgi:hypothetical protein
MVARTRNTLLLVVALLTAVPVKPPHVVRQHINVTEQALLPASAWWIIAGAINIAIIAGHMIYELACMDCSFRGHGAGGDF